MTEKDIVMLSQFGECQKNVSFQSLTTLKIGGDTKALLYPHDSIALMEALKYCFDHQIDYKVLGHGSNILASDEEFDGLIIKLTRTQNRIYFINNEILVEAGAPLVLLADQAMKKSLSGLEWAAGIPASVGGAVFMNAGAYKRSMSDVISEVLVLKDNQLVWMSHQECQFSYRHSIFHQHPDWIIISAKLKLEYSDMDSIKSIMFKRKQQRMETQPLSSASCGSTFRNPSEKASWQYIEESGLRGFSIGGAQVSFKHANFLINTGHASAKDMLKLIHLVQQTVKDKFNVDLQLEVEPFNWKKTNR